MRARHITRPPAVPRSLSAVRYSWRRWRRSRPFWGGLLLIIGGIELLALPLTGVLSKGALRLVVYIGIGGVFGVLIGILLITAGIAIWASPAHRVFYGIAGVVLGIASFPASNLGGFFLCMLLSIIGGSIAFAWTPVAPAPQVTATQVTATPSAPPAPANGQLIPGLWDEPASPGGPAWGDALPEGPPAGEPEARKATAREATAREATAGQPDGGPSGARRMLALAALPVLMSAGVVGAHTALSSSGAAASSPSQTCILGIICLGGSSSSPTASPSPSYSLPTCLPTALPTSLPSLPAYILKKLKALPQCLASALPTSLPTVSGLPTSLPTVPGLPTTVPGLPGGAKPSRSSGPKAKSAAAGGGVVVPAATSVITASSATMDHFTYAGNAKLPTASGGTVTMMKFTASSLSLSGAAETITEAGHTVVVSSPVMAFDGNVTLYAARLSGKFLGIPITLTPTTIGSLVATLANLLTSPGRVTLTNVTTDQATGIADSLTYGPGGLGFSVALH